MKRYFRIYKQLCIISLSELLAYRGNFLNSLISSLVWGAFSIVSILLLTAKTKSVFGWTREEIILLTCSYSMLIGIFHLVFSRNFEYFSRIMDLGQLDTFLLKPLDSQFLLSLRRINYTSIIRIFLGGGLLIYILKISHQSVSPLQVFGFSIFLFAGILIMFSLWYMITSLTIWFNRLSNIVEFLYSLSGISRYPPEMYKELSWYVFLFLFPLTLIIATPTKFLLAKFDTSGMVLSLVFGFGLFFLSRLFWKFALKHYTSASS